MKDHVVFFFFVTFVSHCWPKEGSLLSCVTLSHVRKELWDKLQWFCFFSITSDISPFPLENFPNWSMTIKKNRLVFFHSGRSEELVDTMCVKPLLWRFSTIVLLVQFPILLKEQVRCGHIICSFLLTFIIYACVEMSHNFKYYIKRLI